MAAGAVAELPAGFKLDAPGAGGANLPAGFALDTPTPKPSSKAPAAQPAPTSQGGDWSGTNFVTGNLAKGITNLAGLPVDTATNLANLGIAGYGAARGAMTGRPGESPEPINPASVPMSSGWMQDMLRRAGGLRQPEPESTGGRYGAAMLQALPAAAMGRPTIPQVPRAMTAAATSGAAGELGADIGGEEYRGVASMAPGARSMQTKAPGARATEQRQAERFGKAREMDIPVPPRELKADRPQQSMQNVANQHLGQPEGTEITPKTLQAYRGAHEADYTAAFKSPALGKQLAPSPEFQQRIQALGDEFVAGAKERPQTFSGAKKIEALLKEYGYGAKLAAQPQYSAAVLEKNPQLAAPPTAAAGKPIRPEDTLRAIRQLREKASAGYQSDQPESVQMAKVQKGLANALEELVETNLAKTPDKALVEKFRAARTAMAKSYDIEAAIDPSTRRISGARLSSLLTEGRPLSGKLADMAEVAGQFPSAARPPKGQDEMFTKKMSPMAMSHPPAMMAHQAGRLWDPLTLSRPYQSMIDPRRRLDPQQEQLIRAIIAAQGANREIPAPPR